MKRTLVHSGFFTESPTEYTGEYIYKVVGVKEQCGAKFFLLEHDGWVKMTGREKYVAGRMKNERWGRVEELELDDNTGDFLGSRDLGFVRLELDKKGQ